MADLHYQCAWTWKPPSRHTHRGCLWGCLTKVGGLTLEQHPMDWGPEWMQQRKSESWTPASPAPLLLLLHCRHNVTQTFLLWQSTSSDGEPNIQVPFLCLSIYVFLCMFVSVWVNAILIQAPVETKRVCWIPWRWNYRWLCAAQCEWWELNLGPPQVGKQVLLTTEPSQQPWSCFCRA